VKKEIRETKDSLAKKILYKTLSSWLVGKPCNTKIRGGKEEMSVVAEALAASKRFNEELYDSNATVESVVRCLGEKHVVAQRFEEIWGVPWPL